MIKIGRVDLWFVAFCCGVVPLGTIFISTPFFLSLSTDTLRCCFSAAVSLQAMCGAFGLAEKLPPAVAEAAAKSFACLRAVFCAYGRLWVFQTRLAERGVCALIL